MILSIQKYNWTCVAKCQKTKRHILRISTKSCYCFLLMIPNGQRTPENQCDNYKQLYFKKWVEHMNKHFIEKEIKIDNKLLLLFLISNWWSNYYVVSDSWDPMDHSLPGSSVHGIFPGKNTQVGWNFLFQGILPTQGSNPSLLHCRWILYWLSYQGSQIF